MILTWEGNRVNKTGYLVERDRIFIYSIPYALKASGHIPFIYEKSF